MSNPNTTTFDNIINEISKKISDIEENGEKNYSIKDVEDQIKENKIHFTGRGHLMRLNTLQKRLQQISTNTINDKPSDKDQDQERLNKLRLNNERKKADQARKRDEAIMNAAVYNRDVDLKEHPNFDKFMALPDRDSIVGGKKKSRRKRHSLKKRKSTKSRKSNRK